MAKNTSATKAEIKAALHATKRTGPVLSARKQDGYIILHLCGDKEPVRWKPPAPKTRKRPARAAAGGASKSTSAEG